MAKTGQKVAYLRVSTGMQNMDRQEALREQVDRVFEEKQSGGTRNRPALEEMLAYVREGDSLTVWSMDRLARSLRDLESIVTDLTEGGVSVHFVQEGLEFLPGVNNPFATFQMQVIGAFAQLERSIGKERQAEGIAVAKQKGKYKGGHRKLTDEQVLEAQARIAAKVPVAVVARELGVSRQTVYREIAKVSEPCSRYDSQTANRIQ